MFRARRVSSPQCSSLQYVEMPPWLYLISVARRNGHRNQSVHVPHLDQPFMDAECPTYRAIRFEGLSQSVEQVSIAGG